MSAGAADAAAAAELRGDADQPLFDWPGALAALRRRWVTVLACMVVGGAAGFGASFLIRPLFTAQALFLPPQAQRSVASAALSQLSALGSMAGISTGNTTADQYAAIMQSRTAFDEIIDKFALIQAYDVPLRFDARKQLARRTAFAVGKKDGLISVSVDDEDPQRAAQIANHFVTVLQKMSRGLVLTEAQQRRKFFEMHLAATKDSLLQAQRALESAGFSQGALQGEPRAVAEGFARLRAELTTAEMRLQVLKGRLADASPEVVQQQAVVSTLRSRLREVESSASTRAGAGTSGDYISRFREFKYQETLFEMYARQFELARADESREGALIQVIDAATAPERKSSPKRSLFVLAGALLAGAVVSVWTVRRSRP